MRTTGTDWLLIAVAAVGLGAAAVLGALLVRAGRRHRRALADRQWLLERERETAARAAVTAERARIARELHDIVSHKVSLMVVQTTAAREVLSILPEEAATALRAVEGAGRQAMTELRQLLGLLAPSPDGTEDGGQGGAQGGKQGREQGGEQGGGDWTEPDGPAGFAPQPTLGQLGSLVDGIAFAGLPVEVRIFGEPRPLPSGIDVTAYRIVQEALTNALKYGDGGKAEVTVRYAVHSLRVEVLNSGPSVLTGTPPAAAVPRPPRRTEGAGRGLLGLRERVAVYGGQFDARRRLGGGFRVRARIPLQAP